MRISYSHAANGNLILTFDYTELEMSSSHKHISVTLDDNAKWSSHINNICNWYKKS